jgi:hypothetical protein
MYKCVTSADFDRYVKYFLQYATVESNAQSVDRIVPMNQGNRDQSVMHTTAHDLSGQ